MLTIEKVWKLCVENRYYTRGTNEQYDKMFSMVSNGEPLYKIAENIAQHSANPNQKLIINQLKELSK